MEYPTLTPIRAQRETVEAFRGLNRTSRPGSGEFRDMENLTSDSYPVLSPRSRRGVYARPASPQGLIAKDPVCYVDGEDFLMGEVRIPMGLSTAPEDCPKQLTSMGAYVIILPDRKYINTADPEDHGDIEASFTAESEITFSLCRPDGEDYGSYSVGTAPEQPENGDLWLDTAQTPNSLKQWSQATGQWVTVASTYVRLTCPGIGADFDRYDGVEILLPETADQSLAGGNILWDKGEDYLVVTGLIEKAFTLPGGVTIRRRMPDMDFLVEAGNRLWGCRYGMDEHGEFVNRLYASKLGDFKNWNCYMGLSTDSYYANVGTDGAFTGAVTYLGAPLFFKENCLHRVYGSYPSEFTVQDTACRGVQSGCGRSLALVGDVLYYKSRGAVCCYDGALPREISRPLGEEDYQSAVAGSAGGKYYISMTDSAGMAHLFVFDTVRNLWHREDHLRVRDFCTHRGKLYAIDADSENILILRGAEEPEEQAVEWMAQTGELGLSSPDRKYISRITLRLQLEPGAELNVYAMYDLSGEWEHLCVIHGTSLRGFAIPIRPRRCDFLQLKFQGRGGGKLYSLTKTVEGGSDIQW